MNEGVLQKTIPRSADLNAKRLAWSALVLMLVVGADVESVRAAFTASVDSVLFTETEPIAQVRRDANEDYVPDRVGDTVTVRGRATMQKGVHIKGGLIFVQDGTAGMAVLLPDDSSVKRGDSLRVRGTIKHGNGLTQLHALEHTHIEASPRQPTPVPLTVSDAHADTHEGRLVRIQGQVVANQSNEGGRYLLVEGLTENTSTQVGVFVPSRRTNEIPLRNYEQGNEITVTGVLSQHDYSPPYSEYYQVLPRDENDLSMVGFVSTHYQTIIVLLVTGGLLAIIVVFTLRTAVRRRTQQLAESRARFRRLAEATFEGIIIHEEGEILDVNRALIDMVGYERDDLVGRAFSDVLSESTQDLRPDPDSSNHDPGSEDVHEVVMVRKDGSTFPAEIEEKGVDVTDRPVRVAAIRNVTERKKWETEILLAKEKAEQMSRLKSSLLNNMNHELRTPITSIIGYAELIMNEPERDHSEFAARIRESGKRLSRTLQSVLEMAQIESGTLDVQPYDVEVMSLVREVLEEHQPMAGQANLSLNVRGTIPGKTLYTDRSLVRRALSNLVHNAIKFTEEGSIRIDVEPADPGVRVAVSDPGIGIDPSFRRHLFEPFKQESQGRARTHEGTGLGLALTKRVVNLLGGTIEVESVKGKGSTFVVEIPPVVRTNETETALKETEVVETETV